MKTIYINHYKQIMNNSKKLLLLQITNSNIKFYFKKTIANEEDFLQFTIPPGFYEIESVILKLKGELSIKVIKLKQIIHSR